MKKFPNQGKKSRGGSMNKIIPIIAMAGSLVVCGCANQQKEEELANQKILRENEQRLHELENSVTSLNTQMEQLNNRVYEVRTRNGQKTSMRVVPVAEQSQSPAVSPGISPAIPVSPARPAAKAAPRAKVIDPKSRPAPLPTTPPAAAAAPRQPAAATPPKQASDQVAAGATGRIGQPANVGGPSGRINPAAPGDELGLPPADLPAGPGAGDEGASLTAPASNAVAVPTGNVETAIPVPAIPVENLSLPPENANLPPIPAQQAPAAQPAPAASAPAPAARTPAAPAKGEEAAYRAALNAARSGHTAEGIRLFRDFLQRYPNGRYAANADYWIGECLYAEGKYRDALSQFQNVNNSYPSHHKNADALLKAAITLNRLGDKAGADQKFKTLLANFPKSDAARRARAMGAR